MEVIMARPGEMPHKASFDTSELADLQHYVGGYIETAPIDESGLIAIVNEEGKLQELKPTAYCKYLNDILCGPVLICRADWDGNFAPIRDGDLERTLKALRPVPSQMRLGGVQG